jgi:hypothetical protein
MWKIFISFIKRILKTHADQMEAERMAVIAFDLATQANPSVREMVANRLKADGFDGLRGGSTCECLLGEEFMECDDFEVQYCQAGYNVKCTSSSCMYEPKDHSHIQLKKTEEEIKNGNTYIYSPRQCIG